jgi:hypothetical protein
MLLSPAGLGASQVDGLYEGMTLVMTSGSAAGDMAAISAYNAAERLVTLSTPLTALPVIGDGYAITETPTRVLQVREIDATALEIPASCCPSGPPLAVG